MKKYKAIANNSFNKKKKKQTNIIPVNFWHSRNTYQVYLRASLHYTHIDADTYKMKMGERPGYGNAGQIYHAVPDRPILLSLPRGARTI